jgi:hypothetical protein
MRSFARHGATIIGERNGGGIVGLDRSTGAVVFHWDDPVVSLYHHPDFLLCNDATDAKGSQLRALSFGGDEQWRCTVTGLGAIHGFVDDQVLAHIRSGSETGRVGLVDGRTGKTRLLVRVSTWPLLTWCPDGVAVFSETSSGVFSSR